MVISKDEALVSGPYDGDGVTVAFDYDFKVYDETELYVLRTNSDGSTDELVLTTDYTVSGVGDEGGGQITLTAGSKLPVDASMTIEPSITPSQERRFSTQSSIALTQIEQAYDKVTSLVRQVLGLARRSIKVAPGVDYPVDLPAAEAGKVIRWRSDLAGFENGPDVSGIEGAAAAAAAAEAAAEKLQNTAAAVMYQRYTPPLANPITLPAAPASEDAVLLVIDGVPQGADKFTVTGSSLTYTSGWPSGAEDVQVWVHARVDLTNALGNITSFASQDDLDAFLVGAGTVPDGTLIYSPETGVLEARGGETGLASYPDWRPMKLSHSPHFPDPEGTGKEFTLDASSLSTPRTLIVPDQNDTLATTSDLAAAIASAIADMTALEEDTTTFTPVFKFANMGSPTPAVFTLNSLQSHATKIGSTVHWGFSGLIGYTANSVTGTEPLLLDMSDLTSQFGLPSNRAFFGDVMWKPGFVDLPTTGSDDGDVLKVYGAPAASDWNIVFAYSIYNTNNVLASYLQTPISGQFLHFSGFYSTA